MANLRGPGALVVGGDHPGLGVARSLGRRGIPVIVLDDQYSICSFSRYVSRVVRADDLRDEGRTVDAVMDVGRRLGLKDWVLYPTRDENVAAFSRHRQKLSEIYKVTTPDWETVKWAWNKKNTYDLSLQLKVPSPCTWNPRTEEELSLLHDKLPLAIKPAVKENFFYATGAKAWRANTVDELHHAFRKAQQQIRAEEIMVQEIIPGTGDRQFSYCAFYRDGRAIGSLVARRHRQHPREFGRAATYVESIDLPIVEELSERLLKAMNYYGLVEIEFKQDPRDQQYKLLDINARTWGFHILGAAAGVDFPYLLFADQMQQTTESCRAQAGVGWLRLLTDIPTAFSDILHGQLSLGAYFGSLRRTRVESVFCSTDAMPFLGEFVLLPYLLGKKYLI